MTFEPVLIGLRPRRHRAVMRARRAGAVLAAGAALLSACALNEGAAGSDMATTGTLSGVLHGTGASSMRAAQEVWRAGFQTANPNVTVNYSPDGSGAGRTAFADGAAAFAGSDRALTDDEMAGVFANCVAGTQPINLPVYISPIAIIFNVDGVRSLNLNAPVVAGVFRGEIANWNDPAIAALNPGVSFPDLTITPVHRSDKSGTTENFTAALSQTAPQIWTDKPAADWPATLGGEAADKTTGVVAAVQNGAGTIGYADLSGVAEGMAMAGYSRDGSEPFVGPTASAAAENVAASSRVEGRQANDWALDVDRTAAGYPFVLVSYLIVCQRYEQAATGELVRAYVAHVVSDAGQQAAVPHAGNAPLAGELARGVQAAAATIS